MQNEQMLLDLEGPDYSVRRSRRAKYLQLSVSAAGRVEVILPQNVSERHVPEFVMRHRQWIHERLQQLDKQDIDRGLPDIIELPAAAETWRVNYSATQKRKWKETVIEGQALLCCRWDEVKMKREQAYAALSDWLTKRAKQHLPPMLQALSRETGLDYAGVSIRAQKTRWGSCSSKKVINLNRALLFAQPPLVRYLMLHELCHTRYMNHGVRFWQLVARWEPEYKTLDARLNQASRGIPYWALPQSAR